MLTEKHFDLRAWQNEAMIALNSVIAEKKRDFLCVATPGAGKTKWALAAAHSIMNRLKAKGKRSRLVVVTPSDNLKRQWAETAATFAGLDLDPDFKNAHVREANDYDGIVITYALLGLDKHQVHQAACNDDSVYTIVIFDEIHHAGDNLTWGDAVKNSFQSAVFRIALSGTPFRSDANQIPFITYVNETSKADFNYNYDRAVKEDVCRPVYFKVFDGKMKWRVGEKEFEHSFKDYVSPDQKSKRLKTALDSKGNFIRSVLAAANQKLFEIRDNHPNAAGLIFAATQRHANEIARVLEELSGIQPPVVVSENTDSAGVLAAFRESSDPWLVSVKMVSEGVDVPRLRVGVYFTIVKAELFFRQAVGRLVRVIKGVSDQDAFIFMTGDKDLVKMAKMISEEREHALAQLEKKNKAARPEGEPDQFGDYQNALQGRFTPLESSVNESHVITVNVSVSSGARFTTEQRREQDPVFVRKQHLKDRINQLVRLVAARNAAGARPDFRATHRLWIDNGGRSIEQETEQELGARLNFYENILRNGQ